MDREGFLAYQEQALRTVRDLENTPIENWLMGLAGEVGELVNQRKKEKYHGHPADEAKFLDEYGDILWYIAVGIKKTKETLYDYDFRCWPLSPASSYDSALSRLFVAAGTAYTATPHWTGFHLKGCLSDLRALLGCIYNEDILDKIAEGNIEKLRRRYPEGFSEERSINRPHEGVWTRSPEAAEAVHG